MKRLAVAALLHAVRGCCSVVPARSVRRAKSGVPAADVPRPGPVPGQPAHQRARVPGGDRSQTGRRDLHRPHRGAVSRRSWRACLPPPPARKTAGDSRGGQGQGAKTRRQSRTEKPPARKAPSDTRRSLSDKLGQPGAHLHVRPRQRHHLPGGRQVAPGRSGPRTSPPKSTSEAISTAPPSDIVDASQEGPRTRKSPPARSRSRSRSRALLARTISPIALHQLAGDRGHVPVGLHLGAGARGHGGRLAGILEQRQDALGEPRRVVGQRAELAVLARQAFGAHARRDHRDSRRERLQQFHPHARAAQDRADEHRVARQRLAHVLHEPEHFERTRNNRRRHARGGGSDPTTTSRASRLAAPGSAAAPPATNQSSATRFGSWRKLPRNSMVSGSRPQARNS